MAETYRIAAIPPLDSRLPDPHVSAVALSFPRTSVRVPSLAPARSIAGAFLLSPLLLLPASLSVARLAVAPGD